MNQQQPLRILIVDDERLGRERVAALLAREPGVVVVGQCTNGVEALHAITQAPPEGSPDLVFLDVQMPDVDGIEVAQALLEMAGEIEVPELIFVTAFSEYMERAFELHAIDYLRKPYTDARFGRMLEHARRRVLERRAAAVQGRVAAPDDADARSAIAGYRSVIESVRTERPDGRIAIFDRASASFALVDAHEIDWLEVEGASQVCVHRGGARFTWRKSISSLEQELAPLGFLRIHRSYLVNAARIERIKELQKGEYSLELRDGTFLDSGRTYRPVIERFLSRMPGGR